MKRFNRYTDNDQIGLMELYSNMYTPTESYIITEQQISSNITGVKIYKDRTGSGSPEQVFTSGDVKVFSDNKGGGYILTATDDNGLYQANITTDKNSASVDVFSKGNTIDKFTTQVAPVVENGVMIIINTVERL